MLIATITEAKKRHSALIDKVKAGEPVLIVDRGSPVARLGSALTLDDAEGRLSRLEGQGLVRRGTGTIPDLVFATSPPAGLDGTSIVDDVIAERLDSP